mgnify:CR=1 FL=1
MKAEEVLRAALDLVEPDPGEELRVKAVAERALNRVRSVAESSPYRPQVKLGGSHAKGTWVRGDVDIDIFVLFDPSLGADRLEDVGLRLAESAMKGLRSRRRFSEHPYVEAFIDDVRVNVVPCFDVQPPDWISAADRSPHHTRLIIERFDDGLRRETRLLKKFMKFL